MQSILYAVCENLTIDYSITARILKKYKHTRSDFL